MRNRLITLVESRIHGDMYVRFGGEYLETYPSNRVRRRVLSLQDADNVFLLHKPDYYDPDAVDRQGHPWKNRGVLIRAKCREGERNVEFEFQHDSRYKKISDYFPTEVAETKQTLIQPNLFNNLTNGKDLRNSSDPQ